MIFEKEGKILTLEEFEKLTGAKWVSLLQFEEPQIPLKIHRLVEKLHAKGELTFEQLWLGQYFKKEILTSQEPKVAIRYINADLGWGVFALAPLKKMRFIAEYVGKVRKRQKSDEKNSYCFEYLVTHGERSLYTIDAAEQGGLARYINHSNAPNLESTLATFDNQSHVILYTKEAIAKDAQLCYDYGPDYWAKRSKPTPL